jgi:hypothetical protein
MAKISGRLKATRNKKNERNPQSGSKRPKKAAAFSVLEKNILKAKGISDAQIKKMIETGIQCRDDFRHVGDAETLAALVGASPEAAATVMSWALGASVPEKKNIVVESGDVVRCVHCGTKQPKDYKSGDLCISCGKQAEPIMGCFWCSSIGPGRFCRQCGAEFVPTGELELAILLKREGLPKQEIPEKLRNMSADEKGVLWGRARRY